jgi:hypothetical protein
MSEDNLPNLVLEQFRLIRQEHHTEDLVSLHARVDRIERRLELTDK